VAGAEHVGVDRLERVAAVEGRRSNARAVDNPVHWNARLEGPGDVVAHEAHVLALRQVLDAVGHAAQEVVEANQPAGRVKAGVIGRDHGVQDVAAQEPGGPRDEERPASQRLQPVAQLGRQRAGILDDHVADSGYGSPYRAGCNALS
jgi:hypothetical protein